MGITQSHEFCKAGKAIPQALAFAYGKPDDDPVVHVTNYCTFVNLNFYNNLLPRRHYNTVIPRAL